MKKIQLLAFAGLVAMTGTVGTSTLAAADPTNPAGPRALAGVGSDTTQNVLNALSDVVTAANGGKLIASYDAEGGGTISTRSAPGCTFTRPNGSGAGRTALLKSLNPSDPTAGCIDFARSSSLTLTPTEQGLTYIPFALDAVSYAVTASSPIPKDLSKARLAAIYRCEDPSIPAPLLPQSGSGTRAFWLAQLGLTESTKGACVVDTKGGRSVQENDGTPITGAQDIIPFSVATYIAQGTGAVADTRGVAVLGSVDGAAPTTGTGASQTLNPAFGIKRTVYNVVPTARLATAPLAETFVGASSKVCQQASVIRRFGFGVAPDCGSTTNQTPSSGAPTAPAIPVTPVAPVQPVQPVQPVAPVVTDLRLTALSATTTNAGAVVTVRATGTSGRTVELVATRRPSATPAVAARAVLDATGTAVLRIAPTTNTRLLLRYAGEPASATATRSVSVRTVVTLNARRVTARSYVFEGRVTPGRPGQVVTLFRAASGKEIAVASVRTDATGAFRIPRRFVAAGATDVIVRSEANGDNASGASPARRIPVR